MLLRILERTRLRWVLSAFGLPFVLGVVLLAMAAPANAVSQPDWLSEMPSVATVAEHVRQYWEEGQQRNPALVGDDDFYATRLVGTLMMLRWTMQIEAANEGNLSAQRAARRREIEARYLEAEKLVGRGVLRRPGAVPKICAAAVTGRAPPGQRSWFDSSGRQHFASLDDCYAELLPRDLLNIYISASYRKDMFSRLFCDRAARYLALDIAREELRVPTPMLSALREPADEKRAGLVCADGAGDKNNDGLCDEWMQPSDPKSRSGYCGCVKPWPSVTNAQFDENPNGLFGPFATPLLAVEQALPIAVAHTTAVKQEFGFDIVRDKRCTGASACYYFTAPVSGSGDTHVSQVEYEESLRRGRRGSCLAEQLEVVADAHTHPTDMYAVLEKRLVGHGPEVDISKSMSCSDLVHASDLKALDPAFAGSFMIHSGDLCIQYFSPPPDMQACEADWIVSATQQSGFGSAPNYERYMKQVQTVCPNGVTR